MSIDQMQEYRVESAPDLVAELHKTAIMPHSLTPRAVPIAQVCDPSPRGFRARRCARRGFLRLQGHASEGARLPHGPGAAVLFGNIQPVEPPHPTLPIGSYYMIVRYFGTSSVASPVASDFGRFPASYPWPPLRGAALTGLTVPDPKAAWQRASQPDATLDDSSAFQLHCFDAGSYMNTWSFVSNPTVSGGGPHSIYGYSFDNATTPSIYDSNPATDFVLQASVEIPWFASWPDPQAPPGIVPIGQVNIFAYLRDRLSGKTFALLLAIFDNRFASNPTSGAFAAHDGATPFVSAPISANARYGTLSPGSSTFTGTAWTGLRFFRSPRHARKFPSDTGRYQCVLSGARGAAVLREPKSDRDSLLAPP
jgi:hypothetical protein